MLSCAAGLETLKLMEEPHLETSVREKGAWALNYLREAQEKTSVVGNVRGAGLMLGFDIIPRNKLKPIELRDRIIARCFEEGVCYLPAGDAAVRIAPPLIIEQDELRYGLSILLAECKATH